MRKGFFIIVLFIVNCGDKTIETFFDPSLVENGVFLGVPFPNEVYIEENRRIELLNYFDVVEPSLLSNYLEDISEDTDWFGLNPVVYFWFSDKIDISSLPSSLEECTYFSSPIIWLNIETGEKLPFMWKYYDDKTKFFPANVLALLLYPGFTLRENTLYAVFIKPSLDKRIRKPSFIKKLLNGNCNLKPGICDNFYRAIEKHHELYGNAEFVTFTAFNTGNPTLRLTSLIERIKKLPLPSYDIKFKETRYEQAHGISGGYYLFEMTFQVPLFQRGKSPYLERENGDIEYVDGNPIIQGWETGRMLIALPLTSVPSNGYCVVLYGHGTGGNAETFIENHSALNITYAGCAGAGIDEPLHGIRAESSLSPWLFFNFLNIKAARDNVLQGASELSYYTSILEKLQFTNPETDEEVFFDKSNIYYMGHSQGAIIGVPFLGIEERIKSAVISGGGGFLTYSLMFKSLPFEVRPLIETFVVGEKIDEFEIMLSLFQHFFDPADSINYIGKITSLGSKAKNLFVSEGLLDEYTPPQSTEAMLTAGRIPLLEPVGSPVEGLKLKGIKSVASPISCNFQIDTQCFTIFAIQFPEYGHFAMFQSDKAFLMWREFIETSSDIPYVNGRFP